MAERPNPGSPEKPREIYLQACQTIAERLASAGFSYSKKDQVLTKKGEHFTYLIGFSSSHYNVAGKQVTLRLSANVRSRALGDWRAAQLHPTCKDDRVGGGMLHLLMKKWMPVDWNLADSSRRNMTIDGVVGVVESEVMKYFELFNSPGQLLAALKDGPVLEVTLGTSVEYALMCGDRDAAQSILDRFVRSRSDLIPAIGSVLARFLERGLKLGPDGYAEQVAWLRSAYGLR